MRRARPLSALLLLGLGTIGAVATAAPGKPVGAPPSSTSASVAASTSTPAIAATTAAPTTSASAVLLAPGDALRAYESALAAAKLAGPAYAAGVAGADPFTPEEVRDVVERAQTSALAGRQGEVISALSALIESPRFSLVSKEPEGRAAMRALGDALAQTGVHAFARVYLRRAAAGPVEEGTVRAAARRLTELALEDEAYDLGVEDLLPIVAKAPSSPELQGELEYLFGRREEQKGETLEAARHYAKIAPLSRFWSAATYRRGLLAVDVHRLDDAEALFCQVADPKRQDQSAPVFADERFFAVRDLARLALGRLAHEGKRADDARYYYYLVPQDSKRLAESLYESATSRYEAEDLDGARELLDELRTLGEGHPYDDEAHVLDVYVDVAACKFEDAEKKLDAFLPTFGELRTRVHTLATSADPALRAFVDRGAATDTTVKGQADVDARIWRRLEADPALVFVLRARRRLAAQLAGLSASEKQLEGLADTFAAPTAGKDPKIAASIDLGSLGQSRDERADAARAALDGVRKELASLTAAGAPAAQTAPLSTELDGLSAKVAALDASKARGDETSESPGASGSSTLPDLVGADRKTARALRPRAAQLLDELDAAALALARDALGRLDRRSGRILARARLAKIDVVLGRKKGLEVENDAIRQGILPKGAIDSIDAIRYLDDKEEYWPFEGDEWLDEVVGGEVGER
jgi:hypothetical protein